MLVTEYNTKTMRNLPVFGIIIFSITGLLIQTPSFAQSDFNSEALGLGWPTITINPNSGPPGTKW